MNMLKPCLPLACALVLLSCGAAKDEEPSASAADSTDSYSANAPMTASSSAAVEKGRDSSRRFVRTAALKFKVKDVVRATYAIEDITSSEGGFVTYTELRSEREQSNSTPVKQDSLLVVTCYTVVNDMTLRVPNTRLDTTLKAIARNIDHLDYRIIKADDVALQMLSNTLAQRRSARNETRLTNAIDHRGKKLDETADAEETLLQQQEQADNAKIANLALADQVSYSTVSLHLYQGKAMKQEMIAREVQPAAYEPSLGVRLLDGLLSGWKILESLLVGIVNLWSLVLIAAVVILAFRHYRKKEKAG